MAPHSPRRRPISRMWPPGYADQSHLLRECKRISGRTPARIVRQAPHDEADWMYRL